jgi:hypothetical protein
MTVSNKSKAHPLFIMAAMNALGISSSEKTERVEIKKLEVNPIFGESSEDQRKPMLTGRTAKLSKKKRKALNAKREARMKSQSRVAESEFNEYAAQYFN